MGENRCAWAAVLGVAVWLAVTASAEGQIALDGSMGSTQSLGGPDFTIPASVGKTVGKNLFHSFSEFSVPSGGSATFTGPGGLNNVISRVTGGRVSEINGRLTSEIAGADFWFINPAGVIFGLGAEIDVPASFHVSTADEIRFPDGAVFSAVPGAPSTLTAARPEAFGFLGQTSGSIDVSQSILAVDPGQTLSLVGGDIHSQNNSFLIAVGGTVNLASLSGPGSVPTNGNVITGPLGDISIANSTLFAGGDGGGTVNIRGDDITLTDASLISADNNGDLGHRGGIRIEGGEIRVDNGSELRARALAAGSGGNITLAAQGDVEILNNSLVGVYSSSPGPAGTIELTGRDIIIKSSQVDAGSLSSGKGGQVHVAAGGMLSLSGEFIAIDGRRLPAAIFANALAEGAGGRIAVRAEEVEMATGSQIDAGAYSSGHGGVVDMDVNSLSLQEGARVTVGTEGSADAGELTISASGRISIEGRAPFCPASCVQLSGIYASSGWFTDDHFDQFGDAGSIEITAGTLDVSSAGRITANSISTNGGKSGSIDIQVGELRLSDDGQISNSSASFQTGINELQGGPLSITAADAVIIQGRQDPNGRTAGIFSDVQGSGGGNKIQVISPIILIDGGRIISNAQLDANSGLFSIGSAGEIFIIANDKLVITNEGQIFSGTESFGAGNTIEVTAGRIQITGTGDVEIATPDNLVQQTTGIFSNVKFTGFGDGGKIIVHADDVHLRSAGAISAQSSGAGRAGDVQINAANTVEVDNSVIESAVIRGQGLVPTERTVGGEVAITADELRLRNNGTISARSVDSPGAAGSISVMLNDLDAENGRIITESTQASGGNIGVDVRQLARMKNSAITSEVQGASDTTAGDIALTSKFLVMDGSQIIARAAEGTGGNIRIQADNLILSPDNVIDASSARGISGTVVVTAPEIDFSGGLAALPATFVDPSSLMRESCAARHSAAGGGSFTRAGRGGLPAAPDGQLPALYGEDADAGFPPDVDASEGEAGQDAAGVRLIASCGEPR